MRKGRAVLGIVIATSFPALCIVAILPDPPTVVEWKFDVTSRASLEADCARAPDPYDPMDGAYRMYRADSSNHKVGYPPVAYRALVSFDFDVHRDPARLLYEFVADDFYCSFTSKGWGFLRLNSIHPVGRARVVEVMREVGLSARASPERIDAMVWRFEAGGIGLDDPYDLNGSRYGEGVVSDHALRLERAGLTIWFSIIDKKLEGNSEPPIRASPEEPRYSISIGFVPAS